TRPTRHKAGKRWVFFTFNPSQICPNSNFCPPFCPHLSRRTPDNSPPFTTVGRVVKIPQVPQGDRGAMVSLTLCNSRDYAGFTTGQGIFSKVKRLDNDC